MRVATAVDVPQMRRVWQTVFGDTETYIDFFLHNRCDLSIALVYTVEDSIASQLFLLPADLKVGADLFPVYYLFAAATLPAYRGRGYMGELLRFAEECSRRNQVRGIVLLPGEESLYDYYARFGYVPSFSAKHWQGTREDLSRLASNQVTPFTEDVIPVLQQQQTIRDGIQWSTDALQYSLQEHKTFRGAYAATERVFVSAEEECTILSHPDDFAEGVQTLLQLTQEETLTLRLPPDAPIGRPERSGMLRSVGGDIPLQNGFLTFPME